MKSKESERILYGFWLSPYMATVAHILKESNLPKEIRIGAILRKDDIIIPRSNFIFEKKDLVVFLTKRDQLRKVENLFRVSSF